jgi:ABC-2 type transport system permease protein
VTNQKKLKERKNYDTHINTTPTQHRNVLRIYWLEAKYTFLEAFRLPIYSVSTIVFPMMFYILFGLMFERGGVGDVSGAVYLLATYGAFGTIGASLFGFGVGIASERGQGWMRLKRASPMPPLAYFTAKIFVALGFSAIVILGLFLLGITLGGVSLPIATWLSLFATLLVGALPFCALGLLFGYALRPKAAPVILNLVYLPMAFFSGLWIPVELLPKFVQTIAPALPPYHYAQLALQTLGASSSSSLWIHMIMLLGFTALFLLLAIIFYRRDEGITYG